MTEGLDRRRPTPVATIGDGRTGSCNFRSCNSRSRMRPNCGLRSGRLGALDRRATPTTFALTPGSPSAEVKLRRTGTRGRGTAAPLPRRRNHPVLEVLPRQARIAFARSSKRGSRRRRRAGRRRSPGRPRKARSCGGAPRSGPACAPARWCRGPPASGCAGRRHAARPSSARWRGRGPSPCSCG